MSKNFTTYQSLLEYGRDNLKKHRIDNYIKEAEWLLLYVTNQKHMWLYSQLITAPSINHINQYLHCIELRSNHIPFQLIVGKATFYGRDFSIKPDVFIPRPETELIIDILKKKPFPPFLT